MAVETEDSRHSLEDKVAFLRRPESYPERPRRVEAVETHMSWVFLTERHAYKMKKPVRTGFLDYGSLAARRATCEAELRLNRRLAPGVYLERLALISTPSGGLALGDSDGGRGETVDWLVKMRRLPAARMLDRVIREGGPHAEDMYGVGLFLARFYRGLPPVELTSADQLARLTGDLHDNFRTLIRPEYRMPQEVVSMTASAQLGFLRAQVALFRRRLQAGRIRECHGDLRPEHVCLGPPLAVIDSLEFNRSLRLLDPLEELAFLAMECEFLGASALGAPLFEAYQAVTGDCAPPTLVAFYKAFRACLRARLALWHIVDPGAAEAAVWRGRALRYLFLAEGYTRTLGGHGGALRAAS